MESSVSVLVEVVITILRLKHDFFKMWFLFSSLENKNVLHGKIEKKSVSVTDWNIEKSRYLKL